MKPKYDPKKLFLKAYNYDVWFENEESIDKEASTDQEESTDEQESTDLLPMLALEDDEVKEVKRSKILTINKLLTRLPILLT